MATPITPTTRPPTTALTTADHTGSAPPVRSVRRCSARDLRAKLVRRGGMASQTFSLLVVTNRDRTRCSLAGYPTIAAFGHAVSGPVRMLRIAIKHGTYFRLDPGPHEVVLASGRSASCVLETAMAYNGGADPTTITALVIAPPGATTGEKIHVDLGATGPPGRPVPIAITAFVAGTNGPPE